MLWLSSLRSILYNGCWFRFLDFVLLLCIRIWMLFAILKWLQTHYLWGWVLSTRIYHIGRLLILSESTIIWYIKGSKYVKIILLFIFTILQQDILIHLCLRGLNFLLILLYLARIESDPWPLLSQWLSANQQLECVTLRTLCCW